MSEVLGHNVEKLMTCKHGNHAMHCGWCEDQADLDAARAEVETLRARWRPEVAAFADAMERKLQQNDHKGGWQEDAPHELLRRLIEETAEVARVLRPENGSADFHAAAAMLDAAANLLRRWGPGLRTTGDPDAVRGECADVGNFALMVADRLGAL